MSVTIVLSILFLCLLCEDAESTTTNKRWVPAEICSSMAQSEDACLNNPCSSPSICHSSCCSHGYICMCQTDVFTGINCGVPTKNVIIGSPDSGECYYEADATDYRGDISVTEDGEECQNWLEQYPNMHTVTPRNYPSFGLGNHNKCRNPDKDLTAWCYTTNSNIRYQYCDIGVQPGEGCSPELKPLNVSYLGCHSTYAPELLNWVEFSRTDFTPAKCVRHCALYHLLYASVRVEGNNVHCHCDNMYPKTQPLDESNCMVPCPVNVNSHYHCGGAESVSVYYTGIQPVS